MWLTLAAMRNAIAVLMASLCIVLLGATSLSRTLLLIPTLYVMIDERFPRRITAPDAALALEGETR